MLNSPGFINALFHIRRVLNIANKFLPIYKDIKPITSKIPEFIDKLHNINNHIIERRDEIINNNTNDTINTPKFFI